MTKEERYQQFLDRYESIIRGGIEGEMEQLGDMVKRVMRWLINYEPEIADEALAILDGDMGIDSRNYLSENEAKAIVAHMMPKPDWSFRKIGEMLENASKPLSEVPYYNRWALLTTMSMILSDSGATLKSELGSDIRPAKADEILSLVYKLAIDKLKDKDGRFNIRKYFDL